MPKYTVETNQGTFEIESNRQPTNEEAMQAISSQMSGNQMNTQPQSKFLQETPLDDMQSGATSPISVGERLKLSFADDVGREKYLRNKFQFVERLPNGKFAVGENIKNLQPIDPEGIFNDVLGDIADVVGEVPVIAGQILGTIGGAAAEIPTGPIPTTISGAAIGAGAGSVVKQGIGKILGVNERKAQDMATDVAIEALFGAAGEGLAQGTKAIGKRIIAPKLTKLLDKTVKESNSPGKAVQSIAKLFKATANVNENSTLAAFKYGIDDTFSKTNLYDEKAVIPLIQNLMSTLDDTTKSIGKDIYKSTKKLLTTPYQNIDVTDLYNAVRGELKNMNLLTESGVLNLKSLSKDVNKNLKFAQSLLENLGNFNENTDIFPEATKSIKLPIENVLGLMSELSDEFDRITPRMQAVVAQINNGMNSGEEGLKPIIKKLAKATNNTDYIDSVNNYAEFMSLKEQLPQLTKGGKFTEQFVRRIENITATEKEALTKLNARAKRPFLKDLEQWNAIQDFKGFNPNFLRMGAIAGILGGLGGFDTKPGRGATIGGALLLGTPVGAKFLLRSGSKIGKELTKKGLSNVGRFAARPSVLGETALLSRLLKSKVNQ